MSERAPLYVDSAQRERAASFRRLHESGRILVLPNAWDAASARVFELAGFEAIATTSGGLAVSLGYPDGQKLPLPMLVEAVRRITTTVRIPVSVDLERGYGDDPDEVCDNVAAVIGAGGVGVNLEDRGDAAMLIAKIRALRAREWPVFINARADSYLLGGAEPAALFSETVRRFHAYEEAGADGLFAPKLADAETIGRLVREIHRPLNILGYPGVPSPRELEALGVRRVTVGSGPLRAVVALTQRIAGELRAGGGYATFADGTPNAEINGMFER